MFHKLPVTRKLVLCIVYGCNHNSSQESCKFYRFPANKRTNWVSCRGNIMRVVLKINFHVSNSRTEVCCACTLAQFYLFVHIVCPLTYRYCHFIRLTTIKIKQQQLNNQINYINLLYICKQQIPCHRKQK